MTINKMAYEEWELPSVKRKTGIYFRDFLEKPQDPLELVDLYMRTSTVRAGMDAGRPRSFNEGPVGMDESFDPSALAIPVRKRVVPGEVLRWMGEVYSQWQWETCRTSKEISEACDAECMFSKYEALKDFEINEASVILEEEFWGKDK